MSGSTTSSDDDGSSASPLTVAVATLLGFNGPMRFAAHGATQKAHIVMRRVDPDEDEDQPGVIRFSFFAQKRIEVKPGKEILLAIETDNEQFKDVPLVFEAHETTKPPSGEPMEASCPETLPCAVPPKMRKGPWAKRPYVPPVAQENKVETTSIGVQVSPDYYSTSIQAQPEHISTSVQVAAECSSTSVQAVPQCSSSSAQANPAYVSVSVQQGSSSADMATQTTSDEIMPVVEPHVASQEAQALPPLQVQSLPDFEEEMDISDSDMDEELSPMELESPSSTVSSLSVANSLFPAMSSQSSQTSVPEDVSSHFKSLSPQPSQPRSPQSRWDSWSPKLRFTPPPSQSPNWSQSASTELLEQALPLNNYNPPNSSQSTEPHEKPRPEKKSIQSMFVPAKLATGPQDSLASIPSGISKLSTSLESSAPSKPPSPSPPTRQNATLPPNAVASSSKVVMPYKPIPTGPKALLQTPAPDPLQNPLGIRPSTAQWATGLNGTLPTEPKAMVGAVTTKKVIAVDGKWSASRRGVSKAIASAVESVSAANKPRPKLERDRGQSSAPTEPEPPLSITPANSKWKPIRSEVSDPPPVPPPTAPCAQPKPPPISQAFTHTGNQVASVATRKIPTGPRASSGSPMPPSHGASTSKGKTPPYSAASTSEVVPTQPIAPSATNSGSASVSQPARAGLPTSSQAPMMHPLPPRPITTSSTNSGTNKRGIKRDRPCTPVAPTAPVEHPRPQQKKRTKVKCPLIRSTPHQLKGASAHHMSFNHDGSRVVLCCSDNTVRVWRGGKKPAELAQLSHHALIVDATWLAGDEGFVVLTADGVVHQWKETVNNEWQWSKLVEAGDGHHSDHSPICFAYVSGRIAVSLPRQGVRTWFWDKTSRAWREQRLISRHNVTAITFNSEGTMLVGGTTDGVLWCCEVPNGTLRAYSFLKNRIISLDLAPQGEHVLVGQQGGSAVLVRLRSSQRTGVSELVYTHKVIQEQSEYGFGAVFATDAQAVLLGSVESCVLVWDRAKATIVYGLEHDLDDCIESVAAFDGYPGNPGSILTATRRGQLCWWPLPVSQGDNGNRKRRKKSD